MLGLFDRPACQDEIAALTAAPVIPDLTEGVWVDPGQSDHAGAQLLAPARLISDKEWTRALSKLRRVGLVASDKDKRLDAPLALLAGLRAALAGARDDHPGMAQGSVTGVALLRRAARWGSRPSNYRARAP